MFKFLLVIILFSLLMVFLLGFSFLRGLRNLIFGPPERQQPHSKSGKSAHSQQQHRQKPQKEEAKIVRKLMEEAEYVDYEEVKD
ncbi:MAG: DUF4834 family protein [Dysgonamonadaceae bacterium]|nr:DUF4834 family protein [Dysgonamonadaceae bacterium]